MIQTEQKILGGFSAHAVAEPTKSTLVGKIRELVSALSPHGRFPGPNPCSIERADLKKKISGNWLCEKTDGTRVLLVFLTHEGLKLILLVTRAWDVYVVPIQKCPKVLFQGTVFDGELIFSKRWMWLGFDAVMVSGIPVFASKLSERLDAAKRSLSAYVPHPEDPLVLGMKQYFRDFDEYKKHLESACHAIDGTIVTPEDSPVVIGRHPRLFKLKNGNKHTVDFEFSSPNTLSVYDPAQQASVPVGNLVFQGSLQSGCVVEAAWSSSNDWTLVTIRTDKVTSNDMLTYNKTMINIRENLQLCDLEARWIK